MSLTPVTLTDTFDVWRTRTNQIIVVTEETTSNVSNTRNIAVASFGQANLAFTQANNVGGAVTTANNTAIAAFGRANSAQTIAIAAFTQANNVGGAVTTANSNIVASFNQANTATTIGSSAFNQANTATTIGSSAFNQANTATTIGSSAFGQANLAFTQANNVGGAVTTANNTAIAAFGRANSAQTIAIAAFTKANDSSVSIISDTVNTNRFISFLSNSSGSASSLNVSTSGLFFNPSTRTVTSNNMNVVVSLGVGTAPSGTTGEIRATNDITAYFSSDIRLKTNIIQIKNALDKIKNIRGVEFDWADEYLQNHGGEDGYFVRKHDVGVIAQEIEKVLPEVVAERDDGIKAVKYDRVVALLIEAVKELADQVKELKDK
jgi:hypothetical protein